MLHNNKMSISVPFKTQHFSITCSRFRGTTWRGYTLHSKFKTKLAKCVIWHLIFPGRDCDIACVLLATVGWYVGMIKENAVYCYVSRCVQWVYSTHNRCTLTVSLWRSQSAEMSCVGDIMTVSVWQGGRMTWCNITVNTLAKFTCFKQSCYKLVQCDNVRIFGSSNRTILWHTSGLPWWRQWWDIINYQR